MRFATTPTARVHTVRFPTASFLTASLLIVPLLLAAPAAARDQYRRVPTPRAALAAGCLVQQPHTPAGKPVHARPIVHCTDAQRAAARARAPGSAAPAATE